jgi:hypothetical protein
VCVDRAASFCPRSRPVQVARSLEGLREDDQDGNAVVVDEVVLLACGHERGVSRLESTALSFGFERRIPFQDDVDLVGCVPNWRIRGGAIRTSTPTSRFGDSCTTSQPPPCASSRVRTCAIGKNSILALGKRIEFLQGPVGTMLEDPACVYAMWACRWILVRQLQLEVCERLVRTEDERSAPSCCEYADRCAVDARAVTGVGCQGASDIERRAKAGVFDRNDELASCQLRNCGMALAECADVPRRIVDRQDEGRRELQQRFRNVRTPVPPDLEDYHRCCNADRPGRPMPVIALRSPCHGTCAPRVADAMT